MSKAPATHAAAVLLALAALVLAPAAATAAASASLTDIENDVMCVACREPLSVAQSPQAYAERSFIRSLIAQGQTKSQIERQLVAQYGPAVLGRPPASGFNLTVYVLPPALVLFGIAVLVIAIPRWRRRARTALPLPVSAGASLDAAEKQRLNDELSHYSG
jgi:cytochrome c-type biogenesis protein CcmH